jgi:hypothetical protein
VMNACSVRPVKLDFDLQIEAPVLSSLQIPTEGAQSQLS